jgi:hypothetical protein
LATADGSCEACADRAPFSTDDGWPFLEVHHVKMLSNGGSDRITNPSHFVQTATVDFIIQPISGPMLRAYINEFSA